MNERLYYVKYLFAILWKYIEYFAMNLLKRYLSKTFGPNRMIFFQMYGVKATFLSMFPKAPLLLNLEWKLALCLLGNIFLLLNLDSPMLEPDCAVFWVSEWTATGVRRVAQRSECYRSTGRAYSHVLVSVCSEQAVPPFGGTGKASGLGCRNL